VTKLPEILKLYNSISISCPLRKHSDSLKPWVHLSVTTRTDICLTYNYSKNHQNLPLTKQHLMSIDWSSVHLTPTANQSHVVQCTVSSIYRQRLSRYTFVWNIEWNIVWISNPFNNMCCLQNYFETGARGRDVRVHTMKAYMESRDINPPIHNIVIRQRPLVSLML
jgi:hypothetical protein